MLVIRLLCALTVFSTLGLAKGNRTDFIFVVDNGAGTQAMHKRIAEGIRFGFLPQLVDNDDWTISVYDMQGNEKAKVDSKAFSVDAALNNLKTAFELIGDEGPKEISLLKGLSKILEKPVIRPGARVNIILVAESDDAGSATPFGVLKELLEQAGKLEKIRISGLFGSKQFGCADKPDWEYEKSLYRVLVSATGSYVHSACGDSKQTLAMISHYGFLY